MTAAELISKLNAFKPHLELCVEDPNTHQLYTLKEADVQTELTQNGPVLKLGLTFANRNDDGKGR